MAEAQMRADIVDATFETDRASLCGYATASRSCAGEHAANDSGDDMADVWEAFCAGWPAKQRTGGIRKVRVFLVSSAKANVNLSRGRTARTPNREEHTGQQPACCVR